MAVATYTSEPKTKAQVYRVVYEDEHGGLHPRNTEGELLDAKPFDAPKTLEYAQEHARWIVDGTLWGPVARVQERQLDGVSWHTVYTYADT